MYLPVLPAHVNLDPGLSTRQRGVLLSPAHADQKQTEAVPGGCLSASSLHNQEPLRADLGLVGGAGCRPGHGALGAVRRIVYPHTSQLLQVACTHKQAL